MGILLGVQDAKDNDAIAFDTAEKFVVETTVEQTPKAAVSRRCQEFGCLARSRT